MPAPKKKTMPAAKGSGKAFKAPTAKEYRAKVTGASQGVVNAEQGYAQQRKLQKPNVVEVKRGAALAKLPGTLSGVSRRVRENNENYNAGYISGKKEIAAAKRNTANQAMKKMGKKK